uniref:Isocitrate lyase n=1 Tax=Rhabditophanes sp. KR3021 TaxID=114890 RepID=A0AC35TZ43_9BILA
MNHKLGITEAGFGGSLNCYELARNYIEAGVAGIHFEDQLGSEKKCGHLGGKVLIPTSENIRHLNAARLAADVCGTPTLIVARTDAESARLLTSDIDPRDHEFIDYKKGRTAEGFYQLKDSNYMESCISRAISYSPCCDLIWMETSKPSLSEAREFVEGVRAVYPDKLFAYNCSPSFNWKQHLKVSAMENFQSELGKMGFKYQFITLAGYHANSFSIFDLARGYKSQGMAAYSELQEKEFANEKNGYTATKHQREVGTGYFDKIASTISKNSSTTALAGSTETAQFQTSVEDEEVVTLTADLGPSEDKVLSPDALRFLRDLHYQFEHRRLDLLEERKKVQGKLDDGSFFPDFSPKTRDIREDMSWKGAEIPKDMLNRKVEITGPTDRKMVINAFNSGAKVFMADFEGNKNVLIIFNVIKIPTHR